MNTKSLLFSTHQSLSTSWPIHWILYLCVLCFALFLLDISCFWYSYCESILTGRSIAHTLSIPMLRTTFFLILMDWWIVRWIICLILSLPIFFHFFIRFSTWLEIAKLVSWLVFVHAVRGFRTTSIISCSKSLYFQSSSLTIPWCHLQPFSTPLIFLFLSSLLSHLSTILSSFSQDHPISISPYFFSETHRLPSLILPNIINSFHPEVLFLNRILVGHNSNITIKMSRRSVHLKFSNFTTIFIFDITWAFACVFQNIRPSRGINTHINDKLVRVRRTWKSY